jgi:hypothetical protein
MKKQTFNIRVLIDPKKYSDHSLKGTKLTEITGQLIEKHGVKIILHESLESIEKNNKNWRTWNLTEYNTGMTINSSVGTMKNALNTFEKLFNDPCLTDSGHQDKLRKFNELIEINIKKYGNANQ